MRLRDAPAKTHNIADKTVKTKQDQMQKQSLLSFINLNLLYFTIRKSKHGENSSLHMFSSLPNKDKIKGQTIGSNIYNIIFENNALCFA